MNSDKDIGDVLCGNTMCVNNMTIGKKSVCFTYGQDIKLGFRRINDSTIPVLTCLSYKPKKQGN